MRLGMGEILLILAVVLLIFGPTKLPQLGDALGKGIRSFKRATAGEDEPQAPTTREAPRLTSVPQASQIFADEQAARSRTGQA